MSEEIKKKFGILICPRIRTMPDDIQIKCDLCGEDCFKLNKVFNSVEEWENGKETDISNYDIKTVCLNCVIVIVASFEKQAKAMNEIARRSSMLYLGPDGKLKFRN